MSVRGSWLKNWVGLVVESACPLCQRPTAQIFCQDCARQIQQCRIPADMALSQLAPSEKPFILAWGHYRGALKRAIAALKYHNQPETALPLGEWLAQLWQTQMQHTRFTVVPIPLHCSKQKMRGFNQAELIARRFCEITGLPLRVDGLVRTQATQAQFQAGSAADRLGNLAGAFQVGPNFQRHPPRYPVLLVDDIYTTGATMQTAILTLQKQGIPVAGVTVVARATLDLVH